MKMNKLEIDWRDTERELKRNDCYQNRGYRDRPERGSGSENEL